MFRVWKQNLPEKIVALTTAIVLTLYVQAQLHPVIERKVNVPIEFTNKPLGYEVTLPDINTVAVSIRGVRGDLEEINPSQIRAVVDLSKAALGENRLPLTLRYPHEWNTFATLTAGTLRLKVTLATRTTRRMPVQVQLDGTPDIEQALVEALTEPNMVSVSGAADAVKRVKQLILYFDLTGLQGDIEMDMTPNAVDEKGNPVIPVQVNPQQVRVRVRLVPQPTGKIVPVSPRLGELPPFPYRIVWFSVEPLQVQVKGSPAQLRELNVIETEPISFANTKKDTETVVDLHVPRGIQVEGSTKVRVRVRVRIQASAEMNPDTQNNPVPPPDKPEEPPPDKAPDTSKGDS
jgi:YbbR domain-containing protein